MIRSIIERTGVKIDVEDDGRVNVASADEASAQKAIGIIQELTATPELNKTYMGKVQRITDFGAFVEIMPGLDGLLHVSEIAHYRVKDVRDELKEGEQVMVKVINIDPSGKIRLSRKALLQPPAADGRPGAEGLKAQRRPAVAATTKPEGRHACRVRQAKQRRAVVLVSRSMAAEAAVNRQHRRRRGCGRAVVALGRTHVAAERRPGAAQVREIVVVGDDFAFAPARIEVQKDDLVQIKFTAKDIAHSFTIDAPYRISKRAGAGRPIVFEFRADETGRFPFYCNLTQDERCKQDEGRAGRPRSASESQTPAGT